MQTYTLRCGKSVREGLRIIAALAYADVESEVQAAINANTSSRWDRKQLANIEKAFKWLDQQAQEPSGVELKYTSPVQSEQEAQEPAHAD